MGEISMKIIKEKDVFLRAVLLLCAICICMFGMSACKKRENDSDVSQKSWVRGWYLEGKSQPLLITDPDYFQGYPEPTPIALSVQEEVDLSQYEDGDIIELEVDGINETYPCQTMVYDVRFIEHGDIMDIDQKVLEQLAEYGWIELNTVTTID